MKKLLIKCWWNCLQVSISLTFYVQIFHTKVSCTTILKLNFGFVIFSQKNFGAKAVRKMLVNLTKGGPCLPRMDQGDLLWWSTHLTQLRPDCGPLHVEFASRGHCSYGMFVCKIATWVIYYLAFKKKNFLKNKQFWTILT